MNNLTGYLLSENIAFQICNGIEDLNITEYMVYILMVDNNAIVIGVGKKNRAKVIFDNETNITKYHIKSIVVKLYQKYYPNATYHKIIIPCENRISALEIEKDLHEYFNGNKIIITDEIKLKLDECKMQESSKLIIKLALLSSYSALSDLHKWKKAKLINEEQWNEIAHFVGII